MEKREFTLEEKKEYAEKKKAELNELYKLVDVTAEKLFTISDSPKELIRFLDIYSQFSYLGINNALLIYAQYPTAKEIHPISYWNESNFRAKKGQKSFSLIEKGSEYTKKDGSKAYNRNAVKYFDVSQTTAPYRIPEPTHYYSHTLIKALLSICPVKYENYNTETASEVWGDLQIAKYYPKERKILVRKGLEADVFFRHFSSALAMAMMDRGKDFSENQHLYHFDACCVSYLLCKRYNIDFSINDFDYIPDDYMNYDTERIKSKLYEINDINKVINEKMYREIQKIVDSYKRPENIKAGDVRNDR